VVYAALGDEGRARPLTWLEAEAATSEVAPARLVSAESAQDILDVLYGSPAPPGRMPSHLSQSAPDIAYKTGTSYGFRDAWAAGVSGGYAVIVWTGRPDAAPRAGVTGRAAALPALFDLVDAIARTDPDFRRADPRASAPRRRPRWRAFPVSGEPPVILFPPEDAELWAERPGRGFVLSARGEGALTWYADGVPLARDAGGSPVFAPRGPGFYRLAVVDEAGRTSRTRVQVRMPSSAS
jgi:penicillin-binding protein 1C